MCGHRQCAVWKIGTSFPAAVAHGDSEEHSSIWIYSSVIWWIMNIKKQHLDTCTYPPVCLFTLLSNT